MFFSKIFSVKYANQSDLRITFDKEYENQADLKVYKVEYANQSKGNKKVIGIFVDYPNQSDKKIFFVEYSNQSDLKVFFVDYPNQSGWLNKTKQHFIILITIFQD